MNTASPILRVVFSGIFFAMMALPFSASPILLEGRLNPTDDCLPKYPPPPVVKIKVRVAACGEPGQAIEYRICVENCSTAEAHHVVVKNALPANAKFVKADPEPAKQGPELQWNLGTVGGGAVREIILVLQPTNKDDVKNCARVQFEHGQCVVTRQTGSRPPIISTVPDAADMPILDLVVRGPKDQYTNLPAKYEITVTNTGKTKATRTLVAARLPKTLKLVRASEPAVTVENEPTIAWSLGTLEPGASRVMELTLKTVEKGEHCFKVEAEADHGVKKDAEFCTKFAGVSGMTMEMYDSVDPVFVGDKTSYPVVIRSQGSEPVTNVRLRVFIPEAMKLERATPPLFEKREPVKGGEWIEFKSLPKIDVGTQARYEIFVEALLGGVTRLHVEVTADQLDIGRPVIEQESTTVVDDRAKGQVKPLSRTK